MLSLELVSMENSSNVVLKPTDVLSIPLQKMAAGVILVHNHPLEEIKLSVQIQI
ncbi:MAG: JAB domain-containing protein [Candidatus Amoebophilus sp.]